MKHYLSIFIILGLVGFGCADGEVSNLESAKFALDQSDFDTAITDGEAVLAQDPDSAEAARIVASAYFGRSGIDFLNLAEGLLDLNTSTETNFQQIANVLDESADLDDLRSAITTLSDLLSQHTGTIDGIYADAAFDLGTMQMIEHFALGVFASDFFGTFDVTQITETDRDNVLNDLLEFDNNLEDAGLGDESFIEEVRQTYCILEPISAEAGFTTEEYQALVGCQLSDDPVTFDTAALTPDIPTCDTLDPADQSDEVEACYATDTAL